MKRLREAIARITRRAHESSDKLDADLDEALDMLYGAETPDQRAEREQLQAIEDERERARWAEIVRISERNRGQT